MCLSSHRQRRCSLGLVRVGLGGRIQSGLLDRCRRLVYSINGIFVSCSVYREGLGGMALFLPVRVQSLRMLHRFR